MLIESCLFYDLDLWVLISCEQSYIVSNIKIYLYSVPFFEINEIECKSGLYVMQNTIMVASGGWKKGKI